MTITVNDRIHDIPDNRGDERLLDFLREDLALHGTKNGCAIGACGACTVLVDLRPRRSCVTPLKKVDGKAVLTIEGLSSPGENLHPIQQAFVDAGAIQCGFCTPGMVLSAYALLKTNPQPRREEVIKALQGNLCRCTGYQQIIDAVLHVSHNTI